jgi:phage recombination protein Bet
METTNTLAVSRPSALGVMATRLNVEPAKLLDTLKATVFKGATNEELMALVVVANEYELSPFLKEMYAFPAKGGGITPIVSIDGWTKIVNRRKDYDGVTFSFNIDTENRPVSCTARMHVKGRAHPVEVTEFLSECSRNTEPWRQMPMRMLRHKAFIQAARLAFGLSGIHDEDEANDIGVQVARSRPIAVSSPPQFLQISAAEVPAGATFIAPAEPLGVPVGAPFSSDSVPIPASAPASVAEPTTAPRRGRPPGSKNKPKETAASEPEDQIPGAEVPPPAAGKLDPFSDLIAAIGAEFPDNANLADDVFEFAGVRGKWTQEQLDVESVQALPHTVKAWLVDNQKPLRGWIRANIEHRAKEVTNV